MDLGIAGKVAFVSGGSMGMGRTTSELFAREGCRVVVAALPEHKESIDDTVAAIQAGGGQAVGVAADLTKEDDVDRAVATAEQAFGSLPDIAVANVGGPKQGDFLTVTNDDFADAVHDMTMSMVYLARAVIPHMREQRWGRIVALNSGAAKEPPPELPHILANTSRAAVIPLNKSLSNLTIRILPLPSSNCNVSSSILKVLNGMMPGRSLLQPLDIQTTLSCQKPWKNGLFLFCKVSCRDICKSFMMSISSSFKQLRRSFPR